MMGLELVFQCDWRALQTFYDGSRLRNSHSFVRIGISEYAGKNLGSVSLKSEDELKFAEDEFPQRIIAAVGSNLSGCFERYSSCSH
jgi:hypothetical protein